MNMPRGTISFQLFGVPVFITPFSWLFLALLGGGYRMSSVEDLPDILLFVVIGMITLLCHEVGHALVGRWLGGRPYAIVVEGFGAVTHSDPPETRGRYFLMVLAGPVFTLIPALLTVSVLLLRFIFCGDVAFCPEDDMLYSLCLYGICLPVCWCVFNLLPVLPLDGGHLLATLLPWRRLVCIIGLVASVLIAVLSLVWEEVYLVILFGYFAYINIKLLCMRE